MVGIIVNFWIIWKNQLAAGLFAPQDITIFRIFVDKPYTKIYVVFLGILMALQLEKFKDKDQLVTLRKNKWLRFCLYLTTVTLFGYVTLSPFPAQVNPVKWTNLHNSFFIALSRPLFIMTLMLLMALMLTSKDGWLVRMFSSKIWCPLAKLSYLVYLVFPIVSAVMLSSLPASLMLSYYTMFYLMAYCITSSFLAALLVYLFIESPVT